MSSDQITSLLATRAATPGRIAELAEQRAKPADLHGQTGRLLLVAADHPARGALRAGPDPMAMADRGDLLRRLHIALGRPGVDGVLATADVLEDLLVLGALEHKVVIGSMNRGGLAGSVFEIDDRFTGYDAASIASRGWQGGKMLLRIDLTDSATAGALQACAAAVNALSEHKLMAMVEPFMSHRRDGRLLNDLSTEAVIGSVSVAAGLGWTSAYTWLKLPVVTDMQAVLRATTLPVLLLGGEVGPDQAAQLSLWSQALASPNVRGMVVGRSLLYPPGGDVAAAVDATVEMM